jgi:glyoxylase-like metal-dependent hydrolase (beta-lactamase superfamily II)
VTGFVEVADGVHVLRYPVYDVNVTLIVGSGAALLVDTLSTARQAADLADAARRVTPYPWTLVNTHHHFDHCYGNATLITPGAAIWGHQAAAARLRASNYTTQTELYEELVPTDPQLAADIASVRLLPPDHTVHREATLDVGGREVRLLHLGRGHTDGDLVVSVPDTDLLIAGDLVEESGPPSFNDAYPLEWPETLAALLRLAGPDTIILPGHGAPVDRGFVTVQHRELTDLEWLIRAGHADDAAPESVAARAPFGATASLPAIHRGYAELRGTA